MSTLFPIRGNPSLAALLGEPHNPSVMQGLGDYPGLLPNRVIAPRSGGGLGPIVSPTVAPAGQQDSSNDLLARLPAALSMEFRTRFPMVPREAMSFIAPSTTITVAAGAAVAIVSQQVNESFSGFLTHVGIAAFPEASLASITWQIRVNGATHPLFSNRIFAANNLNTPWPFSMEIVQNKIVELVAINGAGAPIDVAGILVGWTEFLSAFKAFGSSPQTGIG